MLVSVWVPTSRESFDHTRIGVRETFYSGPFWRRGAGVFDRFSIPLCVSAFSPGFCLPAHPVSPCGLGLAVWYSIGFSKLLPCASRFKPHLQAKFALPIVETSDISSEESGLQWGACQEKLKSLSSWERGGTLFWDGWNILQREPRQEPSRLPLGLPADLGCSLPAFFFLATTQHVGS